MQKIIGNKNKALSSIKSNELRSIEFSSEDDFSKEELIQALFNEIDKNDPRSMAYQRKLIKPKIHILPLVLHIVALFIAPIVLYIITLNIFANRSMVLIVVSLYIVISIFLWLKCFIIELLHIYQRFAPEQIRNKCRFEPSCSEYMIQAIKKYGLLKGIYKGINRLKRCNCNNGGFDMP